MSSFIDNTLYNGLPSLKEAEDARLASTDDDLINGPIRDVFLKHGAQNAFCLYLQHRHHNVDAKEAVVKVEGTAHVMDDDDIKDIESFGNKVVPTTWMSTRGRIVPMELAAVPAGIDTPTPSPEFVEEFLAVLAGNGCDDLFGIDTLAKAAWSETTIGTASVVIPSNNDEVFQDRFLTVAYAFVEQTPKFRVHGRCIVDHDHTSRPTSK